MGLTCCLDENALANKSLEFKVNFRYYKKLRQDKEGIFNNKYGLLCEVDIDEMKKFIDIYELNNFYLKTTNGNHFLLLSKISSGEIIQIKKRLREIQKSIAEIIFDKVSLIINISQLSKASCFLSNLKSSIYFELKNKITDIDTRKLLYEITQEIELNENITDHLKNLLGHCWHKGHQR
jgi:hypothetical protein